jgi:ABC-type lipoprotein release transport system permease subunit
MITVSGVVCAVPGGVAASAWITHWNAGRTGYYQRNSFPIGAFAQDMTCVTCGTVTVVALAWWIALRRR